MDPSSIPDIPIGILILIGIIAVVINSFILMWAAGSVGVHDADFGKCFITVLLSTVISFILSGVIVSIGWIIGFVVSVVVIKYILDVEWGRAVLIYIMMIVISIVIGIVLAIVLAGCMCLPFGAAMS